MPDEPKGVEAAQASGQQGLAAAAGGPQAEPRTGEAAQASATPTPEPDLAAQLEASKQALADSKSQLEKLQRDLQAAKTDGGNARELNRELRETKRTLSELQAQMAGVVAQLPHLFAGNADEATRASEQARRPYEQQAQQSVEGQQRGHAQTILSALTKAGFATAYGGDWDTNPEFVAARRVFNKGWDTKDPELTETAADMVTKLLEGRTNGATGQARPGSEGSPAVAAKVGPAAATVQQPAPKPREGLDLALGPGAGAGAETTQALVNRLARGEFLTTDQMAKAKKAMEEQDVYPVLNR